MNTPTDVEQPSTPKSGENAKNMGMYMQRLAQKTADIPGADDPNNPRNLALRRLKKPTRNPGK